MTNEELIAKAKSVYGTGLYDDATLVFLFPELQSCENNEEIVMANKELLETIRKEIISRIDKRHLSAQAKNELISVLSFLSTLESEKPMEQDGLEEEFNHYCFDFKDPDTGEDIPRNQISFNVEDALNVARHFAQWGADHTPLPEDTVLFNKGVEEGKRLMMEEAVEGEFLYTPYPTIELDDCKDYDFKDGQKVRIIIVKEN